MAILLLGGMVFYGGCNAANLVGILGSPSNDQRKIPAEYDLAEQEDKKILVIVNQGSWLETDINMRYYLTEAINKMLASKVGISGENLVTYGELSQLRSGRAGFSNMSPGQMGKAFEADMVLVVNIEVCQLRQIVESGFYKGNLNSNAALFDSATDVRLWPKTVGSKSVKVGFEVEDRGKEISVARLAVASAHCIVRSLYNCPKKKYKIADDRSGVAWQSWGN